jgi:hypothetical protein
MRAKTRDSAAYSVSLKLKIVYTRKAIPDRDGQQIRLAYDAKAPEK